ncbi:MAG: class I SAM-dependent methyltransferase [Bacteroidetes bacterium]|nr:class I SAM-dependent methyltransferase [Bacteroidota bacterium]
MSKEQWNSRYSEQHYIYGTQPNAYLKKFLDSYSPGRILFPAEGEGRNAVYAASIGWQVDAFDQSDAGMDKALRLADNKKVTINYFISSLEEWKPVERSYDCIALIFVHLPPELRVLIHQNVILALKPGGFVVFEAFTKNQLPRTSGGPKTLDLLFDASEIKGDFATLDFIDFAETQVILEEGQLHQGLADVVHFVARKS